MSKENKISVMGLEINVKTITLHNLHNEKNEVPILTTKK